MNGISLLLVSYGLAVLLQWQPLPSLRFGYTTPTASWANRVLLTPLRSQDCETFEPVGDPGVRPAPRERHLCFQGGRGDGEIGANSALNRNFFDPDPLGQGFNRTCAQDEIRTRAPHPDKEVISFWSAWRR